MRSFDGQWPDSCSVAQSVLLISTMMYALKSAVVLGCFSKNLFFKITHQWKSGTVRSGDILTAIRYRQILKWTWQETYSSENQFKLVLCAGKWHSLAENNNHPSLFLKLFGEKIINEIMFWIKSACISSQIFKKYCRINSCALPAHQTVTHLE